MPGCRAADPRHADSLNFLGVAALQQGRAGEAADLIGRALALAPQVPAYHCNLASAFRALGDPGRAAGYLQQAARIQPDNQGALNDLGRVLHELGRLPESAAAYERALALAPHPGVLCNLGAVRLDQGTLDAAADCFGKAQSLAPDMPEAHGGLGTILLRQGRPDLAVPRLHRAAALGLDVPGIADDLARAYLALGDPAAAMAAVRHSLKLTDTPAARALFAACADGGAGGGDLGLLQRALAERWGRPRGLVRVATHLLSQREPLAGCIVQAEAAWPRRLPGRELFGTADAAVAGNGLLLSLLEAAPVCGRGLARFLTLARTVLLDVATQDDGGAADGTWLAFWCALAGQCFINEHVFDIAPGEQERAEYLRDALAAALLRDAPVPPLWPVAVGAYLPLARLPGAPSLLDRAWPAPVAALLDRQVREPLQEWHLRDAIPRLTPIEDEVSRAVQQQYEDNPYPRWTSAAAPGPAAALDITLAAMFPAARVQLPGAEGGHDILVAGCGTGQQSIEIAQTVRGARVLAVDLSRASLAYAQRQTEALGVSGIEYAQADLLRLGALDRRFDVIEASGVLHHLADPWEGWRALLSLLRPGGVMRLGLYSKAARQDVAAAREFIAAQGYPPTPEGIRRCRQVMMEAPDGTPLRRLSESSDFGSTSGCRDLLFHVQEHRLTLPRIGAFLAAHGLAFLGFDLGGPAPQLYRSRFPGDPAMTDLAAWDAFEQDHPNTFAGMYQFWVQMA